MHLILSTLLLTAASYSLGSKGNVTKEKSTKMQFSNFDIPLTKIVSTSKLLSKLFDLKDNIRETMSMFGVILIKLGSTLDVFM